MARKLTAAARKEKLTSLLSNEFLGLTIFPTEACNFRCTYCYEDHAPERMSDGTISALKEFLRRRMPTLNQVHISWFGGEPLLAKDIMLDICGFIQHEMAGRTDISFASAATTNGYLLDSTLLHTLFEAGVTDYQISLDGPPEIHNRSRVRADGSGTFDRIWSNLMTIRDSKLPVNVLLRVHIDADTRFQMEPLLELLRKELIHDDRFSVFFRVVSKLGGENDHLLNPISEADEPAVVAELEGALGRGHFKRKSDYKICNAAHANKLIIRANGDIAKCTLALYDERNKVGSLRPDGTLEMIPARLTPWIRGIANLDPQVLSCPWRGFPESNLDSPRGATAPSTCAIPAAGSTQELVQLDAR
ncbi:MAG: radical SAM protein [Terracidiphilus sp.]|jgi:uncharacterized protein